MVVYKLVCDSRHEFEGWFASSAEYDRQHAEGRIECPVCHSSHITRLPSAPYVNTGKAAPPAETPSDDAVAAAKRFLERVYHQSEDVGSDFPEEARKIHYQEAPARSIRGAATVKDFRELQEEGIDVLPLPVPVDSGKLH